MSLENIYSFTFPSSPVLTILKSLKNNYCPRILHPVKLSINNEVKVKTSYKQKQRESATSQTSWKEILKDVLRAKRK